MFRLLFALALVACGDKELEDTSEGSTEGDSSEEVSTETE